MVQKIGIPLDNLIVRKVNSGRQTQFWNDSWIKDRGPLRILFPRLYALETHKGCFVSEKWVLEDGVWQGNWAWRRQPTGRAEGDLLLLVSLINFIVLDPTMDDKWIWTLNESGMFSVSSLSRAIQKQIFVNNDTLSPSIWNSWVPRKVNVFSWRLALNRLPTRDNLVRHGVLVSSLSCLFCGVADESREHCFLSCPIIKIIWLKIWSWWRSPSLFNPSLSQILKGDTGFSSIKWVEKAKLFHAVCMTSMWTIWNWRNKILHASSEEETTSIRHQDILSSVQRMSLLWASHRAFKSRFSLDKWIQNPGELLIV
ncbi:RNA-directed DNA polymerase, eukaryota, Reverse transcriptase zinc-binding domain protein [Artemisia annua]|uniref:RNA-directed DNA polymerase, eukaryota, Reverse transcriptase zinc-binding domain protein n=1 Tax=Artemisia annua TaxID=35608 RepID=A0A2U1NPB6_ARTAN|nr:RNA-directed DNA polymerase, eukaryota, Reverse transcriptase zinc-binding domain protein [Artemisia annua]